MLRAKSAWHRTKENATVLHLGVENAGFRLHDTDSAIIGIDGVEVALGAGDDRGELESDILGVHLGGEAVAQALLLTSGDINTISGGSQVANHMALLVIEIP